MRQLFWRCKGNQSMTNTRSASPPPETWSRSANFNFLFSTILCNFLDGAITQVQDSGRAMHEELASICAAIARSPEDRSALIQIALESIPFSVKEAFGSPPWSWQAVRDTGETSPVDLTSATGVYAYHLMNINNKEGEQNLYVGQTTSNFARRFATHATNRKSFKRPKLYSSKFIGNLKLTRPKNINIVILSYRDKLKMIIFDLNYTKILVIFDLILVF